MLRTKKTLASNINKIQEETSIIHAKSTKTHENKILRFAANNTYHYVQKKQPACHSKHTTTPSTLAIESMSPEELKNYLAKLEAKQSMIAKLIFPQSF